MTENPTGDNVVDITEKRKDKHPWRITAVRYKQGQAMVQKEDGSREMANAFILNIQFLNREPSLVITQTERQKGFKDINIPIPIGITADQLYQVLAAIPGQLEAHLNGEEDQPPQEPA